MHTIRSLSTCPHRHRSAHTQSSRHECVHACRHADMQACRLAEIHIHTYGNTYIHVRALVLVHTDMPSGKSMEDGSCATKVGLSTCSSHVFWFLLTLSSGP